MLSGLPFPITTDIGQFNVGKIDHRDLIESIDTDLKQDLDQVPGFRAVLVSLRELIVRSRPERPSAELLSFVYYGQMVERFRDWRAPRVELGRRLAIVTDGMWPTRASGWPGNIEIVASTFGFAVLAPWHPQDERRPTEVLAQFETATDVVNFYLDYCTDENGDQSKGRGLLTRLQRATGLPTTSRTEILDFGYEPETNLLATPDHVDSAAVADVVERDLQKTTVGDIGGRPVLYRNHVLRQLENGCWQTGRDYFSSFAVASELWHPHEPLRFELGGVTPPPRHVDSDIERLDSGAAEARYAAWLDQRDLPPSWAERHGIADLDGVDPNQMVVMTTAPVLGVHVRSAPGADFGRPTVVCNSRGHQFTAAATAVKVLGDRTRP